MECVILAISIVDMIFTNKNIVKNIDFFVIIYILFYTNKLKG